MKEKILEIKNLTVKDRETKKIILKDISFGVERNSLHLLLGKNGSGKTTLAFSIFGFKNFLVKGKIFFEGKEINSLSSSQRVKLGLGIVFQNPPFLEGVNLKDYFSIFKRKKEEILKALKIVGLGEEFLNRDLDPRLSSGERKKIEIAAIILQRPKLMILDEPDAGLDFLSYRNFLELILKIKKETQATILFITHRASAWKIAEKATLIDEGKLIFSGRVKETIKKYFQIQGLPSLCFKI